MKKNSLVLMLSLLVLLSFIVENGRSQLTDCYNPGCATCYYSDACGICYTCNPGYTFGNQTSYDCELPCPDYQYWDCYNLACVPMVGAVGGEQINVPNCIKGSAREIHPDNVPGGIIVTPVGYIAANPKGSFQCSVCDDGYYLDVQWPSEICTLCPTGCSTCTSAANCGTCDPGYYGENQLCYPCGTGCASCGAGGDCSSCNSGYYLTGTTCTAGCPTGCASCDGYGDCSSCNSGYYLTGSTCTAGCPTGCATCNVNDQCLSCDSGYYLSSTTCTAGCPAGCTSCDTYGNCSGCNSGYYLSGTNCVPGTPPVSCPTSCATCTSSNTCTGCKSPSYLLASLNLCVTNCPAGYVASPSGKSCVACPTNCKTCIGGFVCTACNSGYILLAHGYVTHINAYQCVTSCPAGYTLGFYTNPATGVNVYGSDGSDACIQDGTNNKAANVAAPTTSNGASAPVTYLTTGVAPSDEAMVHLKKPILSRKVNHKNKKKIVLSA